MAVKLTEAASHHVTRYIRKRGKGVGVRLGVKTTGCSGLSYKLEYADEVAPEDLVFEDHGVKVLIDPKSLAYLDGTELDFVREGLNCSAWPNDSPSIRRCSTSAGASCKSASIRTASLRRARPRSASRCSGRFASTRPTGG